LIFFFIHVYQQVLFEAEGTCGGTLLNEEYVLTAAHCIGSEDPSEITITAGMHNMELDENTETTRQVRQAQNVTVHPDYNEDTIKNDLALVRLDRPVDFNENVQPACLPGPDPKPDSEVVLIGWGVTSTGGELSPVLKQTEVQVVDHCDKIWEGVDDSTQLCFKDKTLTSASCQGDSGGPALQEHDGQWVVEGVTIYGHRTCEIIKHGLPDVYTRVSAFLPWIHSIIDQ
jgi:secreted trypsin-like serine protease